MTGSLIKNYLQHLFQKFFNNCWKRKPERRWPEKRTLKKIQDLACGWTERKMALKRETLQQNIPANLKKMLIMWIYRGNCFGFFMKHNLRSSLRIALYHNGLLCPPFDITKLPEITCNKKSSMLCVTSTAVACNIMWQQSTQNAPVLGRHIIHTWSSLR